MQGHSTERCAETAGLLFVFALLCQLESSCSKKRIFLPFTCMIETAQFVGNVSFFCMDGNHITSNSDVRARNRWKTGKFAPLTRSVGVCCQLWRNTLSFQHGPASIDGVSVFILAKGRGYRSSQARVEQSSLSHCHKQVFKSGVWVNSQHGTTTDRRYNPAKPNGHDNRLARLDRHQTC